MKQYQTQRVMLYFEIKQLLSDNFKISQISNKLSISRTTVYFYAEMSEEEFLEWVRQIRKKCGKLSAYENRIKDRLNEHPDLSSYQVHDWLLEHFPDLEVSRRTVSSEVHKVYFMIMVLSRSRYKHIYFINRPFTSAAVIWAHEEAFAYFGGVPLELVYDQDKLMVVSENAGDILFTEKFSAYIKVRKFEIFLCHKSDPETKGKSESVVKYVKTNFLKNRLFISEQVINAECLAWLKRTGNGQVHGTTKRIPAEEFLIEKQHLSVLHPVSLSWLPYEAYHVRKDNLITWKSNRYSVPEGTYQGKGTKVWVKVDQEHLVICSEDKTPIARHEISLDKGMTIINSNHRRDRSQQINQLMEEVGELFTDKQAAQEYFAQLQKAKGRYIRDQLLLIKQAIRKSEAVHIDQALVFCQTNSIFNATDFIAVLNKTSRPDLLPPPHLEELLSKSVDRKQFSVQPQTSDITDYEAIVNSK